MAGSAGSPSQQPPRNVADVFSLGDRCPARIELSDFQVVWLKRRPCAGQQVRRYHGCLLEYRHDGPHSDLAQQYDDVEWWIRWTLTSSTIEQDTACPAVRDSVDEPEEDTSCLLFDGHPGRHSFDQEQSVRRAGVQR
jgi:hypothetical protein